MNAVRSIILAHGGHDGAHESRIASPEQPGPIAEPKSRKLEAWHKGRERREGGGVEGKRLPEMRKEGGSKGSPSLGSNAGSKQAISVRTWEGLYSNPLKG